MKNHLEKMRTKNCFESSSFVWVMGGWSDVCRTRNKTASPDSHLMLSICDFSFLQSLGTTARHENREKLKWKWTRQKWWRIVRSSIQSQIFVKGNYSAKNGDWIQNRTHWLLGREWKIKFCTKHPKIAFNRCKFFKMAKIDGAHEDERVHAQRTLNACAEKFADKVLPFDTYDEKH